MRGLLAVKLAGEGRVVAAHFDHNLRPESHSEAEFAGQLCVGLGIACHLGLSPPGAAGSGGDGLEAAAREARYRFLQATAEQVGARYLVTAHTANDQAETVLHRIVRGTGLEGLQGIPPRRELSPAVTLVRPLLAISRREVEEYLQHLGQPWCCDSSNADLSLTRNRIRHDILPRLEEINPEAVQALLRLARVARDAQAAIEPQIEALLESAVRLRPGVIAIDGRRLMDSPAHVVREVLVHAWRREGWPLQSMGFDQWDLLARMVTDPRDECAALTMPGAVTARRVDHELILTGPSRVEGVVG